MWEVIGSRHQRSSCRRWLQQRKWCQPLPDQRQYYPCGSVAGTRENTLNRRIPYKTSRKGAHEHTFFVTTSSVSIPNFHPERSLYAFVCVHERVRVRECVRIFEETASFASENWSHTICSERSFRKTYDPVTKTEKLHIRIIKKKRFLRVIGNEESSSKESKF